MQKKYSPELKLYWWHYHASNSGNFGDEITRLLVEDIAKRNVIWSPPDECELAGAGSILEVLIDNHSENKPYIWGSGFIEQSDITVDYSMFKFLGVRGKFSMQRIINMPDDATLALGDPGLLADRLIGKPKKLHKLGVVPHYQDADIDIIKLLRFSNGAHIIDPTQPCETVLNDIASCDAVISSSLHGLIVADSLGVPNIHTPFSSTLKGGLYKFHDYYSAFEDHTYQSIKNSDLMKLNAVEISNLVQKLYAQPKDLEKIKKNILNSLLSVYK